MGTLRCTSRSIVLKNALRSLSRCTLAAGQKQKPQKVESTALYDQQNGGGVYLPLFMGVLFALHQKPNKTKARTNADFLPDCFSFSQRHDSRSRSPHKTQAANSLLFFYRIQSQKGGCFKAVTIPKNTSLNCTIQHTIFYAIFYCLFFNLYLHFWLLCGIL